MHSQIRNQHKFDKKSSKKTIAVCIIITAVFFTVFTVRLIDWQLINSDEYTSLADSTANYTIETDAIRGEILDRSGNGLVVNNTHYKVVLDKLYIDNQTLDETILKLIDLVEKSGDSWEDALPIEINESGSFVYSDDESGIETLFGENIDGIDENTSAADCIEILADNYKINSGYTNDCLRNLVSVHYNMDLCGYSDTNPYIFSADISQKTVALISENTQDTNGVEVRTYLTRSAVDADLAPHLIGALGAITEDEYQSVSGDERYSLSDNIGKFGIELACESQLKGTGGQKIVRKNSEGEITDTIKTIDAQPGSTVYLTIDSSVQAAAVKSLSENVKAAKKAGADDCKTGAAVMLSVKDFSVIAAASYPTYDLNKYSEYGDYYIKLSEDENSPMFNRAFSGSFACGSVFKPCVAAAALEEGIISKDTEIYCSVYYDYYPSNVVECMHYHGSLNVTGALTKSCNFFFAETGRRLGIETMYLYAEKFGLGEYTGVEIEESKGFLAGRDSTSWVAGNTVQAAIGQSDNAFTPLQLATYAATIANDGTRLKTHLISKITNYERTETIEDFSTPETADNCSVSRENLEIVQKAMLGVTQSSEGTAYSVFGNYKVKVAAKTGTAENSGTDHTVFICYAPYDDPEVAVAVIIEHGAKGKYSMQVAKDMLDAYFGFNE